VPTVTGRVLFVLILLSHQRRRIVYFNIAEHPTGALGRSAGRRGVSCRHDAALVAERS